MTDETPFDPLERLVAYVPEYRDVYPLVLVLDAFASWLLARLNDDADADAVRRSLRFVEALAASGERHRAHVVAITVLEAVPLGSVPEDLVGPATRRLADGDARWDHEDLDPAAVHRRLLDAVPELGPLFGYALVMDDFSLFVLERAAADRSVAARAFGYVEAVHQSGSRDEAVIADWSLFAGDLAWPDELLELIGPVTRRTLDTLDLSGPLPVALLDEER